jgi:hypothetical protein
MGTIQSHFAVLFRYKEMGRDRPSSLEVPGKCRLFKLHPTNKELQL